MQSFSTVREIAKSPNSQTQTWAKSTALCNKKLQTESEHNAFRTLGSRSLPEDFCSIDVTS